LGPRSKSYQYYNQKQVSCFGVGIYYVNQNLPVNRLSTLRVNIFSDVLIQDGEAVVRNLKYLMDQTFFKEILGNKKRIVVFCDVGSHFRKFFY
jgi:hypothetical protein